MLNRIAALFALIIILFQTFALPAAAVQPWKGDPWKGNSWTGDSWEGDTWQGDSWEGKSWDGDSWQGDSWSQDPGQGGSDWNGLDFDGNPWNTPGYNGNPWNTPGYNGDPWNAPGYNGNPWNTPGYNGNPWNTPGYNGNPWNTPGYNGNPWNTPGYNGNLWNTPGYNGSGGGGPGAIPDNAGSGPSAYDITKLIANDYVGGQIRMIGDYMEGGHTGFYSSGSFMTGLLLNGIKTGMGDKSPWAINAAADGKQAVDMGYYSYKAGKAVYDLRTGVDLANVAARGSSTAAASSFASISKFSAVGAGIAAVFSGYETGVKAVNAIDVLKSGASGAEKTAATADATASFGETLFNVGAVATAFPGGQVAGAVMMGSGAVIWGASKVTKFIADGSAKKALKKATGWVKGLFGK